MAVRAGAAAPYVRRYATAVRRVDGVSAFAAQFADAGEFAVRSRLNVSGAGSKLRWNVILSDLFSRGLVV